MVRCEAHDSVHPEETKELGVKIEIKNMNFFSACGSTFIRP